jgi:hypothetical protein
VSLPTLPLPQDGPESEMSHTKKARVRVWSRVDWAATERMTGWGRGGLEKASGGLCSRLGAGQ